MYIFNTSVKGEGNNKKDVLVLFSGQLEGDENVYSFMFESEYIKFLKPDAVMFIYPNYLDDSLKDYFKIGSKFIDNITRYGSKVPVEIFSFNGFGVLKSKKKLFGGLYLLDLEKTSDDIVKKGLFTLAKNKVGDVILKSPPGTVFSKPSGQISEEFIKASELTRIYSEQQFVAFCLLTKRPQDRDIKKIFIDTASISAFVEAVTYYFNRFENGICKTVKYMSFSSYGGMDNAKPDIADDVWVIISASVHNSMCEKITADWGLNKNQVVTILSYEDDERILVNIRDLSKTYENEIKIDSAVKVQVHGENFTAEVSKPKSITIKAEHKPKQVNICISNFFNKGVFKCNKAATTEIVKPIYIDFNDKVIEDKVFSLWFKKIIKWYLPNDIGWVVVNDSDADKAFLKIFNEEMERAGNKLNYEIISYRDASDKVLGECAVVILAPVISNGRSLLDLNRDMRLSGHEGNRIFLSAFVTSNSKSDFKKLKKSLLYGPYNLKYLFLNCYELFVGHSERKSSWDLEREVLNNLNSDYWNARQKCLEQQGVGLNNSLGCPPLTGDKRLSFTQNFAFWSAWDYEANEVDHESVYITISTILQNLRENNSISGKGDSLQSHIYQHAVIDPDNFTRFNDSLLQSCLWRAANATELDYRRSDELSEAMASIIIRLANDMTSNKSEAAIDLLMGLATRKILIAEKTLENLLSTLRVNLSNYRDIIILLKYMGETLVRKKASKKKANKKKANKKN